MLVWGTKTSCLPQAPLHPLTTVALLCIRRVACILHQLWLLRHVQLRWLWSRGPDLPFPGKSQNLPVIAQAVWFSLAAARKQLYCLCHTCCPAAVTGTDFCLVATFVHQGTYCLGIEPGWRKVVAGASGLHDIDLLIEQDCLAALESSVANAPATLWQSVFAQCAVTLTSRDCSGDTDHDRDTHFECK